MLRLGVLTFLVSVFGIGLIMHQNRVQPAVANIVGDGCAETSAPSSHTGTTLRTFAESSESSGVLYDEGIAKLTLKKEGGVFSATTLAITDSHNASCSGDFDNDGWTDLVVGRSGDKFIYFYRNQTFDNPAPDWTNPNDIRTPKFTLAQTVRNPGAGGSHTGIVCGDFNGDGNEDFAYYVGRDNNFPLQNDQRVYYGNGNGTFGTTPAADGMGYVQMTANSATLGQYVWTSKNSFAHDYNNDGWTDIMFGTKKTTSNSTGAIIALINNCPDIHSPGVACSVNPQFVATDVVTNKDFGSKGINALGFADYNGDGYKDLIAGSPSKCGNLPMWPGLPGGGFDLANQQNIPAQGGATVILSGDMTLDGKIDFLWGQDGWNCTNGGRSFFYRNNGTSTPFSSGVTQQLSDYNTAVGGTGVALVDFDVGSVLDYDNDPDGTLDFIIADGNNSGKYLLFANRVVSEYVQCGEVASGVLDLGTLENEEMVITAARINPNMSVPSGTTVTFFMSNEDPANWQTASPCIDDPAEYCVSFPKPVGRDVRWKAELCSNNARTQAPTITGVDIQFDYTVAEEHYRSGLVVSDGLAFAGAFRQPGHRGHFYALSAALDQTYWDAAENIDSMADSARNIYTVTADGTRLDLVTTEADTTEMQNALNVASETQATSVINWVRSARFGIDGGSYALTKLGAVETSTPAIVGAPGYPLWYSYGNTQQKQKVDDFLTTHEDRPTLALFGSRDGALHAVRVVPEDITDTRNGSEVWAWIPKTVAGRMITDLTNGEITAYPDGSPTVADVVFSDGEIHTVALVASGNGGQSVFAIDITNTIDPDTDSVSGPLPLWENTPGGVASAGLSYAKPAIARINLAGTERFIAILATGVASSNPTPPYTKGREVVAVDVETGSELWRFQAECPVTSDVVVFETDDSLESGSPTIDGYIDRALFADNCGHVYKVNPAVDLSGGWNASIGTIDTGHNDPNGNDVMALFSTADTACALGAERPIVGTLGGRPDATGRYTVFLGTGGIESYDPSQSNAFYAIYADSGEIRGCAAGTPESGRITGNCANGLCEKFYGGVVVTSEQVIVSRAIDPPVAGSACNLGSSQVDGFALNTLENDFSVTTSAASVGSLYGANGAVYFATLAGEVVRIGTPTQGTPGGGGGGNGNGNGNGNDHRADMTLRGWRRIR